MQKGAKKAEEYTQPYLDFMTENPTVWHTVDYFGKRLEKAGFKKVWDLSAFLTALWKADLCLILDVEKAGTKEFYSSPNAAPGPPMS